MSKLQQFLTEYLQSELYHSMGAYRVATEELDRLKSEPSQKIPDGIRRLFEWERDYNDQLAMGRHASPPARRKPQPDSQTAETTPSPVRDPVPEHLPLSRPARFQVAPDNETVRDDRRKPWVADSQWERVPRFYTEAVGALESYARGQPARQVDREDPDWCRYNFARSLIAPRDGIAPPESESEAERRLDHRLARYRHRRAEAHDVLHTSPDHNGGFGSRVRDALRLSRHGRDTQEAAEIYPTTEAQLNRVTRTSLDDGEEALGVFVIRAQAEAHLSMHAVEAWQSMCLGEHARELGAEQRAWLAHELDRSIVLSTYAYSVSRTAPWIFAGDRDEAFAVFQDFGPAWENLVPARCVWIANQISLLALHRRAYAHNLRGDTDRAYNDYHKLQRLIRDTERRVRGAPLHVEGALDFLAGLDAQAHHHIGELYRAEHAHRPALEHFEAASFCLERLRSEGEGETARNASRMRDALQNSRWNVQLQVSRGKAAYELGRHKEALCWHLYGWRAFLELLAADTRTVTNVGPLSDAIAWLEQVRFEPELRKSEVLHHLGPVIAQLQRVTVSRRFGALAAEILLRLGHLLFVLNVGPDRSIAGRSEPAGGGSSGARPRANDPLSFRCLLKAAECDAHSTLVGADLLKARFRLAATKPDRGREQSQPGWPTLERAPIAEQWPRGGSDYEQLARIAEYLMLRMRVSRYERERADGVDQDSDAEVARDLLLSLFMNTDSINVRKSQIHRFLMKSAVPGSVPGQAPGPAIEFVCMRRYSSPFPLLPRPSAFRALGGGYFLRLHRGAPAEEQELDATDAKPYGIVVDPGVDFVENLYRTGYCLDDIDMIVVTHDHVDHLGALDPLLSLLHVRSELRSKQLEDGEAQGPAVRLLVSESVERRYAGVLGLREGVRCEFLFESFEELRGGDGTLPMEKAFWDGFPRDFEIVTISSAEGNEIGGHLDLSRRPSHGICFRGASGGPSLAFTSDTPPPPAEGSKDLYEQWRRAWDSALSADALVVHLGSIPLTELRRLDPLGETRENIEEGRQIASDVAALEAVRARLQEADDRLEGQIEYAQWLRSHVPPGDLPMTADLVEDVDPLWSPPVDHNYLAGLLRWAREYKRARSVSIEGAQADERGPSRCAGLFVVGELSEELGTMRSKVAARLNQHIFVDGDGTGRGIRGLTADIGLHVCVAPDGDTSTARSRVEVLCTTCSLDTDRVIDERFHCANDVYEVCVKGENEGIFYNCREHDPSLQHDPTFLEQLERFDIFGR